MNLFSKVLLLLSASFFSIFTFAQELNWAKTIELVGSNTNSMVRVQKSVTDKNNNLYLFGDYDASVNFNPTGTSVIENAISFQRVFLAKYNDKGDIIWVKTWGSRDYWTYATGLAIDNNDNLMLVLNTSESFDADPDTAVVNIVAIPNKNTDVLLKLDSDGRHIWHQKLMETNLSMRVRDMVYDNFDNLYITGYAYNSSIIFPNHANMSNVDIEAGTKVTYLLKTDPSGELLWSKQLHSTADIEGNGLTTINDRVNLVGYYRGNAKLNPDDSKRSFQTYSTSSNAFSLMLKSDGAVDIVDTFENQIVGNSISLNKARYDEFGNRYVVGNYTGRFNIIDNYNLNSALETSNTLPQSFLIKYDVDNNVIWVRTLVSAGSSQIYNLLIDGDNNPSISGLSSGDMYINRPFDSTVIHNSSQNSGFVVKYNEEGTLMFYVGQTGQFGKNFFNGFSIDKNNNILVASYSTNDLAYNCFPTFIAEPYLAASSNGSRVSFFSVKSCNANDFEIFADDCAIYASIQQGAFTWYDMDNNGAVITDATSYAILPTASGRFRARLKTENGCIYYSDIITFNKPTNIQDEKEALYAIYPNPVVDVLHLESKSVISQVQILDVAGRLVFQEKYTNAKVNIKTSAFTKGLYTMLVWDNDGQKTAEKFVKF